MLVRVFAAWICLACACAFAVQDKKRYEAGDNKNVKGWGTRDFEGARQTGQPLFVYFYNPKNRNNMAAKHMEENVLGDTKLLTKIKPFLILKLKSDGSDSKGWPASFFDRAGASCAVMVATSDAQDTVFFGRDTPKEQLTPETLIKNVEYIQTLEQKKKQYFLANPTAAPKNVGKDAAAAAPAPSAQKKLLPGLPPIEERAIIQEGFARKPEPPPPPAKAEKKKTDGPAEE